MATIVILQHLLRRDLDLPLMAHTLAEYWRARGHRVIEHFGADDAPPGDVAILHLDMTVIPEQYHSLVARYPRVINGAALDVSRHRFSQDLLRRDSDWDGAVIVKTDTNYRGMPEGLLRTAAKDAGTACVIPDGPVMDEYVVHARLQEIPDFVWNIPGLIVERFLPERDERGFVLRNWLFFGRRELSYRGWSDIPLMKLRDLRDTEDVPVPGEIRIWREKLSLDFASFDYAMHGGRYVLFDVNKTPGLGPTSRKRLAPHLEMISTGLEDFL